MRHPLQPSVTVVGGGLAGLSAAIACADAGLAVTLLEARPRLGGATWSFERRGLSFDNGQHVHLRCCEAYRSFLERLGTAEQAPLNGALRLPVLRAAGSGPGDDAPAVAWIRRNSLPAPLHLGGSLLTYGHLSLRDRLRLLPAAIRLRGLDLDDPALDTETFGAWLGRHHQRAEAIARLWDLITLPTTNLPAAEVSLGLAAKVFQTGLLTDTSAADIGWARVPLSQLHADPARRVLEDLGADVRLRARVDGVVLEGSRRSGAPSGRALGVSVEGGLVESDAVILAVPHHVAAYLLPKAALGADQPVAEVSELGGLGTVPIVNVHLVFDRRVTDYAVAVAIESPVQFVFDRTAAAGVDPSSGRQVLAISLSGADGEIGERPDALISRQLGEIRRLFPAAERAELVDAVVTREHDATFRGVPGSRRLRLPSRTAIGNLALAGAWTDTGWPATMEGAVRSGRAAAENTLAWLGATGGRRSRPVAAGSTSTSAADHETVSNCEEVIA